MIEAASLATNPGNSGLAARRRPVRRFQQDERLIRLIRQGHDGAFEVLFNRYQSQLLAYCRKMVGSTQDAEDVLQDVFVAAHATMLADNRPIHARPWLYRIARNRCINHLRKPSAQGVDSMDVHPHEHGTSTLEQVEQREEWRAMVADVRELPETQRTALVLREMGDLSYPDIARTMGKSLPSVKSLLVRARTSLAASSDARPALVPIGLVALLRKLLPAKLGGGSGASASVGSSAGGATGTASASIGGALSAKAAAGLAAAALITAGAVGVHEMSIDRDHGTARAGAAETSAAARATNGSRSSVDNRSAGQRAPRHAARARASRTNAGARAGSGSSPASSAAGQHPAKPGLPVEPPAQPAPSQAPIASQVTQEVSDATATARGLLPPPARSVVDDVVERVDSSLRPVTRQVPPPLDLNLNP